MLEKEYFYCKYIKKEYIESSYNKKQFHNLLTVPGNYGALNQKLILKKIKNGVDTMWSLV